MPPKGSGASSERFLLACLKHAEKPTINFEMVAKEIGMSSGGAQNKYRALLKNWESDKEKDAEVDVPETPKAKTPVKRKSAPKKTTNTKDDDETEDSVANNEQDGSASDPEVSPKKTVVKRKTTVKKTAKANDDDEAENAAAKNGDDGSASDAEESPKKKAKATPKKVTTTPKSAGKGRGGGRKKSITTTTVEETTEESQVDAKDESMKGTKANDRVMKDPEATADGDEANVAADEDQV